ncbi:MAG TPA: asparagine synthase-related protein, partial [Thermoplasmata archaeon]
MEATGPSNAPTPRTATEIVDSLRAGGPAVVALSGGVDSAVVAQLARRALGAGAFAVTLSGPAVAAEEIARASAAARSVGIDHVLVAADPLSVLEYRENGTNRCYF